MMKHTMIILATMTSAALMCGCQSSKENSASQSGAEEQAIERTVDNSRAMLMPRVVVYKTRADYSNHVPVTMDDNKSSIVSYPDPVDIKPGKRPTQLQDGYLLDNFGISRNVVYLDYTFEEYAALPQVPEMETLMQHIMERNPLTEYYLSGDSYPRNAEGRSVEMLNRAISEGLVSFTAVEL